MDHIEVKGASKNAKTPTIKVLLETLLSRVLSKNDFKERKYSKRERERERERERNDDDDDDDDVARSTGWRAWGLDDKILLVRQEVAVVVVVFFFIFFFPRGEFW